MICMSYYGVIVKIVIFEIRKISVKVGFVWANIPYNMAENTGFLHDFRGFRKRAEI